MWGLCICRWFLFQLGIYLYTYAACGMCHISHTCRYTRSQDTATIPPCVRRGGSTIATTFFGQISCYTCSHYRIKGRVVQEFFRYFQGDFITYLRCFVCFLFVESVSFCVSVQLGRSFLRYFKFSNDCPCTLIVMMVSFKYVCAIFEAISAK